MDCIEQYLPPSGSTTSQVQFACKKSAACDKLDCIPNPNRPEKCYRIYEGPALDFTAAETFCDLSGGSLPVIDSQLDFDFIKSEFPHKRYWLSMKGGLRKNFKKCESKNRKNMYNRACAIFKKSLPGASRGCGVGYRYP